MNIFITAGNTQTPVDQVRCITNVFTGKTGSRIAAAAFDRGHRVIFATSHPEALDEIPTRRVRIEPNFTIERYRTFEELETIMAKEIGTGHYQAVIHAAAVNDYHVAGVYELSQNTAFDPDLLSMVGKPLPARFIPTGGGKIKGNHRELWMRLVPAPKLVDKIRNEWKFDGTLVKFKLEVGVGEDELLKIGEASRTHSGADWLVANTLDGMNDWAYLIGNGKPAQKVERSQLANQLLDVIGF